ncbi:methyl-accepting chemotaxis protein, partial [Pseudomonas sp. MAFF212428]|nr:methyl-accepting chemotaxis protein [Pseudomonas brassicae]
LMLALGIFALNQLGSIRQAGIIIEQVNVPSFDNLSQINQLTLRLRTLSYRLLVNRDAGEQQEILGLLDTRNSQIDKATQAYEKLIVADGERDIFNQYRQLLAQYRQLEAQMKRMAQSDDRDGLRSLLNKEMLSNSEQVNVVLDRLVKVNNEQTRSANQAAADQYDTAFSLVIVLLVAATALTLLCALLLTRSIVKPIDEALHAAERDRPRHLTQTIRAERPTSR